MINRSPWLWNANQTAAGMTARTSNGIRILQGKRAPGQSNPSTEFISSQLVAAIIWPLFRAASGFIREMFTSVPEGQYAANVFFKKAYDNAIDFTDPEAPVLIPAELIYAEGVMTPTAITATDADASDEDVSFTWPATVADASQDADDEVWYVIRNRNNGNTISAAAGTRGAPGSGSIVATALDMTAGDNIDFYVNFRSPESAGLPRITSETRYSTFVVVA